MLKNLFSIFFGGVVITYHVLMVLFFLTLQERNKYLFSFNFVALNFVLPQLEQVNLPLLIIIIILLCRVNTSATIFMVCIRLKLYRRNDFKCSKLIKWNHEPHW